MLNSLDRQVIGEIHAHGLSLNEVWKGYRKYLMRPALGLGDAVVMFLKVKQESGLKTLYLASLRQDLSQFSRVVGPGVAVSTIPTSAPQSFLAGYKPATAATKRQRLNGFFEWLIRQGYVAENPCKNLEPIRRDYDQPEIFTNTQVKRLLDTAKHTDPGMMHFLFLSLGLGLRISEAKKITEDAFKDRSVIVSHLVAKGSSRRVVEIPEWLLPNLTKVGYIRPRNIKRRWDALRQASRITPWPRNACRHTAATHLLNRYESAEKVGLHLGNGPKVLHRHYKGLATKGDTEEFWELLNLYLHHVIIAAGSLRP